MDRISRVHEKNNDVPSTVEREPAQDIGIGGPIFEAIRLVTRSDHKIDRGGIREERYGEVE